jgi:hypothetical protein
LSWRRAKRPTCDLLDSMSSFRILRALCG